MPSAGYSKKKTTSFSSKKNLKKKKKNAEKECYDILYMRNWKRNDTNELIYKTETDLQSELMVARGEEWGGGRDREFGINMYTLLYLKWCKV